MARIIHINCPRCGGTLGMVGVDRVVKCRYCSTWSLVDLADMTPEYYVNPGLDEVHARRTVQALLKDPDMPDGLLGRTRFHSARLYFLPFHEITGRRLGSMTVTQYKLQKPRTQPLPNMAGPYSAPPPEMPLWEERLMSRQVKEVDTRVVISDLIRLEPAVRLPEWELEEAEIESLRSDPAGVLKPIDRRAMEKQGKIYDPTVSTRQMLDAFEYKGATLLLDDRTEVGEVRVKRIFYPVWRVRYRFQGRLYGATLDGVTGKVMAARAPQDDRNRVLWMIGASALVCVILGKIVRGVAVAALSFSSATAGYVPGAGVGALYAFGYAVPVALVMLAGALFVLGVGWDQFRYQGELVIQGKHRMVEKIGRKGDSWLDRASAKAMAAASFMARGLVKRREREL